MSSYKDVELLCYGSNAHGCDGVLSSRLSTTSLSFISPSSSFYSAILFHYYTARMLSKRDHRRQKLMGDQIRVFGILVTAPDYELVSFRTGLGCVFIVYVQGEW
jgi:hypothetical protein